MNLGLRSYPKGFKCRILVRNYAQDIILMVDSRTAGVTYCIDVTLFLHATSGQVSLIEVFVSSPISLNAMCPHFLGATMFYT